VISHTKYQPIPKTGNTPAQTADAKSIFRNILSANPSFTIFCVDLLISGSPNSWQSKILAKRYEIFRDMNMPRHPNVKLCVCPELTVSLNSVRSGFGVKQLRRQSDFDPNPGLADGN
jgi:hypothetical protein